VNGTRRRFFMARAIAGLLNLPHKRLLICGVSRHVACLDFLRTKQKEMIQHG
jgi:hypothetical protein